jgi:hypothetical protein
MRMDHPLKVATSLLRSPPQPLVNDNVVKNEIEQPVKKDPQPDRQHIRIVFHEAEIVKKSNGWETKDYSKQVIFLKGMIVNGMMGFVPAPENSVHDIFMRKPCYELPEKERCDDDQGANKICCDMHANQASGQFLV